MRQSCPQPYSDADDALVLPCQLGQLQPLVNSLVYSTSVERLTPYTYYEFQLSVVNEAGSIEQPVSSYATTLPAGISYQFVVVTHCRAVNVSSM